MENTRLPYILLTTATLILLTLTYAYGVGQSKAYAVCEQQYSKARCMELLK